MKPVKSEPYYAIKKWERIINIELCCFMIYVTISIIAYIILKDGNDMDMFWNIVINIGCSAITSIALLLLIYFKFLKHIPDENAKKINELLNQRLGYETTNHNASIEKVDRTQNTLSAEHRDMKNTLNSVDKGFASFASENKGRAEARKFQYEQLRDDYKKIADSIKTLAGVDDAMHNINAENLHLRSENQELRLGNQELQQTVNALTTELAQRPQQLQSQTLTQHAHYPGYELER